MTTLQGKIDSELLSVLLPWYLKPFRTPLRIHNILLPTWYPAPTLICTLYSSTCPVISIWMMYVSPAVLVCHLHLILHPPLRLRLRLHPRSLRVRRRRPVKRRRQSESHLPQGLGRLLSQDRSRSDGSESRDPRRMTSGRSRPNLHASREASLITTRNYWVIVPRA